jgi:hypothetical protein
MPELAVLLRLQQHCRRQQKTPHEQLQKRVAIDFVGDLGLDYP